MLDFHHVQFVAAAAVGRLEVEPSAHDRDVVRQPAAANISRTSKLAITSLRIFIDNNSRYLVFRNYSIILNRSLSEIILPSDMASMTFGYNLCSISVLIRAPNSSSFSPDFTSIVSLIISGPSSTPKLTK